MSTTSCRRPLAEAMNIASGIVVELWPHCERIEIVCIPAPYDTSPLFRSGIALVVEQWEKVKGDLPCRYTQRLHPSGMKREAAIW